MGAAKEGEGLWRGTEDGWWEGRLQRFLWSADEAETSPGPSVSIPAFAVLPTCELRTSDPGEHVTGWVISARASQPLGLLAS